MGFFKGFMDFLNQSDLLYNLGGFVAMFLIGTILSFIFAGIVYFIIEKIKIFGE